MQTGLDRVCLGEKVTVTEVALPQVLESRLMDFGLVPGTEVSCQYRSPGGQVTAFRCRGAVVAMRTRDMGGIRVKR